MLDIRYQDLRLIPSKAAMRELMKLALTLDDCKYLLEEGEIAPRKREASTQEKWLKKGNKTYNIVIVKTTNHFYNEEVYLITHLGRF